MNPSQHGAIQGSSSWPPTRSPNHGSPGVNWHSQVWLDTYLSYTPNPVAAARNINEFGAQYIERRYKRVRHNINIGDTKQGILYRASGEGVIPSSPKN